MSGGGGARIVAVLGLGVALGLAAAWWPEAAGPGDAGRQGTAVAEAGGRGQGAGAPAVEGRPGHGGPAGRSMDEGLPGDAGLPTDDGAPVDAAPPMGAPVAQDADESDVLGPPSGPPPPPQPVALHGTTLVRVAPGGRPEQWRLGGTPLLSGRPRALAAPVVGRVADLCTDGTVLARAGGGDVELRTLASDRFVERLRTGLGRVDRVLCPGGGAVVAVALGPEGTAVWWDGAGRERGRLAPVPGIAAVALDGEALVVLDGAGALRGWDGRRRDAPRPAGLSAAAGAPTGLAPALGGPPWVLGAGAACPVGGACVPALGDRGLIAAGLGWAAVAGPDRVQLVDGVAGALRHELAARPVALFARQDGLLVVEPTGLRRIDPASGAVVAAAPWPAD